MIVEGASKCHHFEVHPVFLEPGRYVCPSSLWEDLFLPVEELVHEQDHWDG